MISSWGTLQTSFITIIIIIIVTATIYFAHGVTCHDSNNKILIFDWMPVGEVHINSDMVYFSFLEHRKRGQNIIKAQRPRASF
jgi:hypothetical protein